MDAYLQLGHFGGKFCNILFTGASADFSTGVVNAIACYFLKGKRKLFPASLSAPWVSVQSANNFAVGSVSSNLTGVVCRFFFYFLFFLLVLVLIFRHSEFAGGSETCVMIGVGIRSTRSGLYSGV